MCISSVFKLDSPCIVCYKNSEFLSKFDPSLELATLKLELRTFFLRGGGI